MATQVGLTDAKIKAIKPPKKGQIEFSDKLVAGLRIRVGCSGVKTYILRKRIAGKLRNITLGRHNARFGLSDARRKSRNLLVDIEAGCDPTVNLSTPRKNGGVDGTVSKLAEQYLANIVRGRKRSAREMERVFRVHIIPALGDRLADSITRGDVSKLVEAVAYDGARETPRMARSVHQQLSSFYTWAMPKLDRLPANPCRDAWRPGPSKPRDRVLSDTELSALWRAADAEGFPFGPLVQLLVLTAQRRGEVVGAEWDEFDVENRVWTIPATRAKNEQANIVPLSPQAVEILSRLPRPIISGNRSKYLFPSIDNRLTTTSGISKMWKRVSGVMIEELDEKVPHFTIHDIRRTVATGLQRLGVPLVVSEAVLNHQSGSRAGVAGVYHRHNYADEKHQALVAWGNFVDELVNR